MEGDSTTTHVVVSVEELDHLKRLVEELRDEILELQDETRKLKLLVDEDG